MFYKRLNNIPWQIVNDSVVIIDPAQNKIHELDEVATNIWNHLDGEHSLEQIATQLAGSYAVEESMAMTDVEEFCGSLLNEGLITKQEHE